jgi:hypothetical protein
MHQIFKKEEKTLILKARGRYDLRKGKVMECYIQFNEEAFNYKSSNFTSGPLSVNRLYDRPERIDTLRD